MRVIQVLGFVLGVSALVACGGLSGTDLFTGDGGKTATESGAKVDSAGSGSGTGQHPGTTVDAGHDTGHVTLDATTIEPGIDAGMTTPIPDATTGLPDTSVVTPPGVPCGVTTCSGSTPVCCAKGLGGQNPSASCVATTGACNGGAPVTCASSADCPTSETCCAAYTYNGQVTVTGVSCTTSCQGFGQSQVCDPNGSQNQCPTGQTCNDVGGGYGACQPQMGGGPGGH